MTNAITTSSPTNQPADAASNADALLKKYSTPLTAATAIVVCVTGVMMFFHLYKGEVQAMHEWLGMGFVVAAILLFVGTGGSVMQAIVQTIIGFGGGPDKVLAAAMIRFTETPGTRISAARHLR